jgi:hypothetical protein
VYYSRLITVVLLGALLGYAGGNRLRDVSDQSSIEEPSTSREPLSIARQDEPAIAETKSETGDPQLVHYTIQPGDSLWRVAAALTGDGENWRRLWPEYEGREKQLQRGTGLEIPIASLREPVLGSVVEER